MIVYKILDFLKSQWLGTILGVLIIFFYFYSDTKTQELLEKSKVLEKEVKVLEKKSERSQEIIDSLYRQDGVVVERIRIIKEKGDEKIRRVDSLTVSELQQYFTDEYKNK